MKYSLERMGGFRRGRVGVWKSLQERAKTPLRNPYIAFD